MTDTKAKALISRKVVYDYSEVVPMLLKGMILTTDRYSVRV